MAQGYTYDPSSQIKQSFKEAGASMGNIFTNIIEQKQRDYKLAENAFQNAEALKKNLNLFGQKSITDKANQLLKEASQAIYENGKLDYSKLGEIRQKISDIGDLKQGYDLGAKEYERMLQLGIANKDNLVSFEKFYKDLSAKMGDESLVKNPQDLQRSMAETYEDNLDVNKMFQKRFLSSQPYQPIEKEVVNERGDKIKIFAKAPVGWDVDAKGNNVMLPNQVRATLEDLKKNDPTTFERMKRKAGVGGEIAGDEGVVQYYLNNIPVEKRISTIATKEKQDMEAGQAKIAKFKSSDAMLDLERRTGEAQLAYLNRRGLDGGSGQGSIPEPEEYAKSNMYQESIPLKGNREVTVNGISLGNKPMKLNVRGTQGLVTDIAKSSKTGDIWAKVYVDESNNYIINPEGLEMKGVKQTWKKVTNPTIFQKQIDQAINTGLYGQKLTPYAKAMVGSVFNAPSENVQKGATPKSQAPVEQAKPQASATTSFGKAKLNGNTYDLDALAKVAGTKSKAETIKYLETELNK